jgi:enamine deaminase RidA (YjgF/YER057c/UK114 family)
MRSWLWSPSCDESPAITHLRWQRSPGKLHRHDREPRPKHPALPWCPYAYAATAAAQGVLIFSAGACPLDEQGQVVALGDVSAQMRQALQNLRIALEESGRSSRMC